MIAFRKLLICRSWITGKAGYIASKAVNHRLGEVELVPFFFVGEIWRRETEKERERVKKRKSDRHTDGQIEITYKHTRTSMAVP